MLVFFDQQVWDKVAQKCLCIDQAARKGKSTVIPKRNVSVHICCVFLSAIRVCPVIGRPSVSIQLRFIVPVVTVIII